MDYIIGSSLLLDNLMVLLIFCISKAIRYDSVGPILDLFHSTYLHLSNFIDSILRVLYNVTF
jgi:hypothetical protein